MAITLWSFGHSECNRVKKSEIELLDLIKFKKECGREAKGIISDKTELFQVTK